ncbi:MAG: N-acetylglucosamine kinase [Chitinophagaceae bacterium]|nr:MAG: N-acetylglucosamine kinase [Chitinophagaceae bacterium]
MILIADSGSTNANWCLIRNGRDKTYFRTKGYNPHFVDEKYIIHSLPQSLPVFLDPGLISEINFYGSGCMAGKSVVMENALSVIFKNAKVNVSVDLLAAARALLGNKSGFAAILGTGTNTCIYDGTEIIHNIDSLGYMLGDEGSGTYIGKKLLQDYLRGYMPDSISEKFHDEIRMSFNEIMDQVYSKPLPNRFCASFAKFAGSNIRESYLYNVVRDSFTDFFTHIVAHYPNYHEYTFNCIGSIGFHFRDILGEVVVNHRMKMGKLIQSSIEALVDYHCS